MTAEEKKKIYTALSAPFPEETIERTDGRVTGRGYSTTGIKAQFVVNRLNDVIGLGNWRLHREITVKEGTTASGRKAYEAIADVVLEFGTWEEGKFLPWAETLADGGHSSLSEADAKKGAASNGLKKAAAMFGCGRQAYEGTIDDDNTPADGTMPVAGNPATHATPPPVRTAQSQVSEGSLAAPQARPPASPPNRNRLTSKQLAALWSMARKAGFDQSQWRQSVKTREGVQPEFLSREAASKLISELAAQLGNGGTGEAPRMPGQEG
jgi:Rad52/22 family double-strand break repair protein